MRALIIIRNLCRRNVSDIILSNQGFIAPVALLAAPGHTDLDEVEERDRIARTTPRRSPRGAGAVFARSSAMVEARSFTRIVDLRFRRKKFRSTQGGST